MILFYDFTILHYQCYANVKPRLFVVNVSYYFIRGYNSFFCLSTIAKYYFAMSLLFIILATRSLLFAIFYSYVFCDKTPISCSSKLCVQNQTNVGTILVVSLWLLRHKTILKTHTFPTSMTCQTDKLRIRLTVPTYSSMLPRQMFCCKMTSIIRVIVFFSSFFSHTNTHACHPCI